LAVFLHEELKNTEICVVVFFGRFGTRGVKKHDQNKNQQNSSGLITKNVAIFPSVFFPSLGCFACFFYRVFGRFVTRGVQKHDIKKTRKTFGSCQKKYLLTYVTFFSPHGAPFPHPTMRTRPTVRCEPVLVL
jgi:hypothetical protein